MRKYLRSFLITTASLVIGSKIITSISFEGGEKTLLLASLILMFANLIIKPILSLLLLPINLLTLGVFRWLVSVFIFYIMLLVVPQVKVEPFLFAGFYRDGFALPQIQFSFFWTLVLLSFIMSFVAGFLYWAFKK